MLPYAARALGVSEARLRSVRRIGRLTVTAAGPVRHLFARLPLDLARLPLGVDTGGRGSPSRWGGMHPRRGGAMPEQPASPMSDGGASRHPERRRRCGEHRLPVAMPVIFTRAPTISQSWSSFPVKRCCTMPAMVARVGRVPNAACTICDDISAVAKASDVSPRIPSGVCGGARSRCRGSFCALWRVLRRSGGGCCLLYGGAAACSIWVIRL